MSTILTRDGNRLPDPVLWAEHATASETATTVYLDQATQAATVVYGPTQPRTSQLALIYEDEARSWLAVEALRARGLFTIRESERPTMALDFVVTGQVTRTLDPETADMWVVAAEVTSLGTATVGITTDLVVRTNLCANSGHQTATSTGLVGMRGWGPNGDWTGVQIVADLYDTHDAPTAMRVTSDGTATNRGINQSSGAFPTVSNPLVTASAWVKPLTPGLSLRLQMQRRSVTGAYIDGKTSTASELQIGEWQRIACTRTDMVPGERMSTPVYIPGVQAGAFLITEWLIEEGTAEIRPWFGVPPGTIADPVRQGSTYADAALYTSVLDRVRTLAPSA